jgi:pimeloyl-ACP methyl ester carboxylesterase
MADFPPWIKDGGLPQKQSDKPGVAELYKSPNVFVNGVPVVLYQDPNDSSMVIGPAMASVITADDDNVGQVGGTEIAISNIQNAVNKGLITQEQAADAIQNITPPVVPSDPNTSTQTISTSNVVVLLFRGLMDKPELAKSSVEVDATAAVINNMQGYRATAFNWQDIDAAQKLIKPDDQVVLYGFSKGGEAIQSFATKYPQQKIALALMLDAYPSASQWISKLPSQVTRGVNWYNPNWNYWSKPGVVKPASSANGTQIQDPDVPNYPNHFAFPKKHQADVITQLKSLKPVAGAVVTSTVNGNPPIAGGQGKYTTPLNAGSLDHNVMISRHFKLGDVLGDNPKLWAQGMPKPPLGVRGNYSTEQVRDNLSLLAQNILDPIYEKYPDMILTSVQRPVGDNKNSQHPYGQAADIQFTSGVGYNKQNERAQWIFGNLPFDQLLLETTKGTGRFWIHVSYNGKGNMPLNKSNKYGTGVGIPGDKGTIYAYSWRNFDYPPQA